MNMTFATVKQLDTAIDQIIVGAKNQRDMIQQIAIAIVSHASGKGSGNVTRAKKLVDGLGTGVRCDSLVQWFALVGINFDDEGNVSLDKTMLTPENFNDAKAKPWSEVKKANVYKGFDYKDALVAQLKKAYIASEKAKDAEVASIVQMTAVELKALEAFVLSQVGADKMPKKPDALKKNTGSTTATAKKAA
jgi:hypothetical protein